MRPSGAIDFPVAVNRTYTITPNGGSGFAATLRLHYLDGELNGNMEGPSLRLWRFNGTSWEAKVTAAFDTTNNWARPAVSQFSPWTFSTTAPTSAPATISGLVTTTDGMPLGGVVMTLTGVRNCVAQSPIVLAIIHLLTSILTTSTPLDRCALTMSSRR